MLVRYYQYGVQWLSDVCRGSAMSASLSRPTSPECDYSTQNSMCAAGIAPCADLMYAQRLILHTYMQCVNVKIFTTNDEHADKHPIQDINGVAFFAAFVFRRLFDSLPQVYAMPRCESELSLKLRLLTAATLHVCYKLVYQDTHFSIKNALMVVLSSVMLDEEVPRTAESWETLKMQHSHAEASITTEIPLLALYERNPFVVAEEYLYNLVSGRLVGEKGFQQMRGCLGFVLWAAALHPRECVFESLFSEQGVDEDVVGAGVAAALFALYCSAEGEEYNPSSDVRVVATSAVFLSAAESNGAHLRVGPYALENGGCPVGRLVATKNINATRIKLDGILEHWGVT